MKPVLIVFVKEPRPGRVKTRLARDVGHVRAAWWYRRHVAGLLRALRADPRWRTVLAVSPDAEGMTSRVWPALPRMRQGEGDLGARMVRALRAEAPGPAAVIGSDILGLGPAHIARAFRVLGRADTLLGPAPDGGYWLIGARHPGRLPPRVLEGVRWSGPHARADTAACLRGAGLTVAEADTLDDADTLADLGPQPASWA